MPQEQSTTPANTDQDYPSVEVFDMLAKIVQEHPFLVEDLAAKWLSTVALQDNPAAPTLFRGLIRNLPREVAQAAFRAVTEELAAQAQEATLATITRAREQRAEVERVAAELDARRCAFWQVSAGDDDAGHRCRLSVGHEGNHEFTPSRLAAE